MGRCRWGISENGGAGRGRGHHRRRLRGFGSGHENAARRVRRRIPRPARWIGPRRWPAGQFTRQGASPSPYIVDVPSQEGVDTFPGMPRDSDRKATPAGDASWGRVTPRTTRPPSLRRGRGSSRFWLLSKRIAGCLSSQRRTGPRRSGNSRCPSRRPHLRRQYTQEWSDQGSSQPQNRIPRLANSATCSEHSSESSEQGPARPVLGLRGEDSRI